MKRHWSVLAGLPVFTAEKELLGHLGTPFIDPETGKVLIYLVTWTQGVSPLDIEKWGHNFVQVNNEELLISPLELIRIENFGLQRCCFAIKTVYDKAGHRLGKVRDFLIDTTTDTLVNFTVSKQFFGKEWGRRQFAWEHISEITKNAVILSVDMSEGETAASPIPATITT